MARADPAPPRVTRDRDITAFVALVLGLLTVMFLLSRYPFDRRAPTAIEALAVIFVGCLAAYGLWRFGRPPRPWVQRLVGMSRRPEKPVDLPWSRVSDGFRAAIAAAQLEALALHHNYIGTEHLLLGLMRDDDQTVGSILADIGAEPKDLERAIREIVKPGTEEVSGEIGLTPRSKRAIELAFDESRRARSEEINTAHLLVGLALVGDGIAAGVLRVHGATPPSLRTAIRKRGSGPTQDRG
jgi:hypothetical protein